MSDTTSKPEHSELEKQLRRLVDERSAPPQGGVHVDLVQRRQEAF